MGFFVFTFTLGSTPPRVHSSVLWELLVQFKFFILLLGTSIWWGYSDKLPLCTILLGQKLWGHYGCIPHPSQMRPESFPTRKCRACSHLQWMRFADVLPSPTLIVSSLVGVKCTSCGTLLHFLWWFKIKTHFWCFWSSVFGLLWCHCSTFVPYFQ